MDDGRAAGFNSDGTMDSNRISPYEAAMLRLVNSGFTPDEAAELLADPEFLERPMQIAFRRDGANLPAFLS